MKIPKHVIKWIFFGMPRRWDLPDEVKDELYEGYTIIYVGWELLDDIIIIDNAFLSDKGPASSKIQHLFVRISLKQGAALTAKSQNYSEVI